MASSRKQQPSSAQLNLLPSLKSCLVNLPASLVAVLTNSNTIAQNVIVELTYRQVIPPANERDRPTSIPRSVYVGWTGMQSQRRVAATVGREGIAGSRGNAVRDQDVPMVEIDPILARLLSLTEGMKIGVILHIDPPQVHTINVEPLTPADWDMIELSAHFLETNFLSQVRALPNPAYGDPESGAKLPPHPITLHLSPTSTVNIIVTSVEPQPAGGSAFVKISPDAEIIVAPKERQRARADSLRDRASSKRSGASTVKKRGKDSASKGSVELRGIDRSIDSEIFDEDDNSLNDEGLKVWVHPHLMLHRPLKGVHWVSVSVARPSGIIEKGDPQKELNEIDKPSVKVVAKLAVWNDAYDTKHVVLSSILAKSLSASGMVGGLVRLQAASTPLDPSNVKFKDASQKVGLKVIPFVAEGIAAQNGGLKFGGDSKSEKESSTQRLRELFSSKFGGNGLLDGPISDGMLLPNVEPSWHGGIVRIDPPVPTGDGPDPPVSWLIAPEKPLPLDFQQEVQRPTQALRSWSPGDPLPQNEPDLVGIDSTLEQLIDNLTECSPVLLTGGLGSGKTQIAQLVAHRLRNESLFHTIYIPCRTRMKGEYKVSNIQDTFNRIFAAASWGALLGGRSVVILDDLDAVCFAETELGEGGDNVRSRNVSAALASIIKQYCSKYSGVVLLATSQSKESLNSLVVGGHVIEETIDLHAPNKEQRRKVLEAVVKASAPQDAKDNNESEEESPENSPSRTSSASSSPKNSRKPGFTISSELDFLDLAGQTDGYMPGDLVLLASRARSECLIRSVTDLDSRSSTPRNLTLTSADFTAALKGFTPASLRNVTLQTSTVKWSSIGGLKETRQILLETLQYPTTYAPIFANCSLRLRSGILLYGYPGCGKTLLASAIASECGLNFISVKGPEILNKYIGASEKSVRDLFERAQAARPCVLFFDEFDAIAPKRGHDSTGVTDRVVNQLLTQMDGAEGLEGVYVLGATSRPDLIDPALLRPGRLDKSIICDMPNFEDRVDILRAVASGVKCDAEVNSKWGTVASKTEGLSGADLQALVYNAHLEAVHELLGDITDTSKFGSSSTAITNGTSKRTPAFDVWLMSEDPESIAPSNLANRAAIAAKLREMQSIKRKRREAARVAAPQSMHHQHDASDEDDVFGASKDEPEDSEPTVQWRHVLKSMSTTRPSISSEERNRLKRIYREFVSGRSGDLPTGEGGTEIGGRSSLA